MILLFNEFLALILDIENEGSFVSPDGEELNFYFWGENAPANTVSRKCIQLSGQNCVVLNNAKFFFWDDDWCCQQYYG